MDWGYVGSVLLGVGWRLALPMILGVLGGVWLDNRLHTGFWLALAGLALGTAVGFYSVYRLLLPIIRQAQGKDKQNK